MPRGRPRKQNIEMKIVKTQPNEEQCFLEKSTPKNVEIEEEIDVENIEPTIENETIYTPIDDDKQGLCPIVEEEEEETNNEKHYFEMGVVGDEDPHFLNDLSNSNFTKRLEEEELLKQQEENADELEKLRIKQEKENEKQILKDQKEMIKQQKVLFRKKHGKKGDVGDIPHDDEGDEIIGHEKRLLLTKINQYKNLFPELKNFKLSKNQTVEYLNKVLDEFNSIISTDNTNTFIMDALLQSIKIVEGITARTKDYNLTGLSDILKSNPQFNKLCKQLFLKYGVFENTPPETQLLMIVITSSWICCKKNSKKFELNQFLNEPIEV
jgi:hypothetical protein